MDSSNVGKSILKGSFYVGIAKYSNIIFQLIVTSILARILTPEDYGIVAIATVFIFFFNIMSDIGIGPAIIQKKQLDKDSLNALYTFNSIIGLFLCIIFFLLSWPIAAYYENECLLNVCQILSLLILFTCLRTVPMNLLYREKKFKYVAFSNLSVQIVTGIAAICAALYGWGVYALVLSQVLSAILLFIVYRLKYPFKLVFKLSEIRDCVENIFSYSIYSFGSSVIFYFSRNLDKILIGKYIGAAQLGYYEKSYRLMFMPIDNITFVITPVLHPIFSDFQNDRNILLTKYSKIVEFLSWISFPLSLFLFFSARELVLIVFGNQWLDSIPVFRILALSVAFQMLTTTVGAIYNAANATKIGFYASCVSTLLMVSGFILTLSMWGHIEAVACGFLISQLIFCLTDYFMLYRTLGGNYFSFIQLLVKPIITALSLYITMEIYQNYIYIDNLVLSLLIKGGIYLIITLLGITVMTSYNLKNIVKLIKK